MDDILTLKSGAEIQLTPKPVRPIIKKGTFALQGAREQREDEKAKICRHTAQMRLQKKLLAVRRSMQAA